MGSVRNAGSARLVISVESSDSQNRHGEMNPSHLDPALAAREPRTATLALNFFAPVWREYIMSLGLISASAASIASVLSRGGCVILVPGGAAEAMLSQPGDVYTLFLRKRRGYARLALEHGATLVPVFSFGENELYVRVTWGRDRVRVR